MQLLRSAVNFAAFIGCSIAAEAMGQSIPLSPTAQASGAVITHDQGIEFVTIGSLGNAPWQGDGTEFDRARGRGGVDHEYRIGRFEVTTGQWAEFFNAAFDRPANDRLPYLIPPDFWGAQSTTPTIPGGRRWTVPIGSEMAPVGDISWRMAAMYCNWLCNEKRTDRAAFLNGAYDVGTFGYSGTTFTDQPAHNPGARYWIPSWDEWLKAAHFDPNRNGPGQAGYWQFSTSSDLAPIYGPPGANVGGLPSQANGGWDSLSFPGYSPFSVLLGAYPTVQSPWGLLDTAGASTEWTEEVLLVNDLFPMFRLFDGSPRALGGNEGLDRLTVWGGEYPSIATFDFGFRIAAAVPTPGPTACGLMGIVCCMRRQRR